MYGNNVRKDTFQLFLLPVPPPCAFHLLITVLSAWKMIVTSLGQELASLLVYILPSMVGMDSQPLICHCLVSNEGDVFTLGCCARTNRNGRETQCLYLFFFCFVAVLLVCRPEGKAILWADLSMAQIGGTSLGQVCDSWGSGPHFVKFSACEQSQVVLLPTESCWLMLAICSPVLLSRFAIPQVLWKVGNYKTDKRHAVSCILHTMPCVETYFMNCCSIGSPLSQDLNAGWWLWLRTTLSWSVKGNYLLPLVCFVVSTL